MAMSAGDATMEDTVSSAFLDSVVSKQHGDGLSPEDVAWVDSCLVKDSEVSESKWNSLKDALLEILSSETDSVDPSAVERDVFSAGLGIEATFFREESQTSHNMEGIIDDSSLSDQEDEHNNDDDEDDDDDDVAYKKLGKLRSRTKLGNASVSVTHEFPEDTGDFESDLSFPVFSPEPSTGDIFKVWDLDIPPEEDELLTQLNKALAESSFQPVPSTAGDSGLGENLKIDSLDDLISGITDLSLDCNPR